MMKHWKYLNYVVRHKWFVFVACLRCRAPLWRALVHDWSKFLPCEWTAYANFFYGNHPKWSDVSSGQKFAGYPFELTQDYWERLFHRAWNHHQKANKHHWQYWFLVNDSDNPKMVMLEMPEIYIREMLADWWGAGRAITGRWDVVSWYAKNKHLILLEDKTRKRLEELLDESVDKFPSSNSDPLPKYIP